ncbi:MAG: hypothetical protein EOO02_19155 [Chitinophagaceae bacterium]|nr:MAG: hypothetical protein EOO02_19155 [Chitinophagaceae bacterium]
MNNNNGISFKFNFETNDHDLAHDVLPVIMKKLQVLREQQTGFRYIELNLLKPGNERKTACLTIYNNDGLVREESREQDWSKAISEVFDQVTSDAKQGVKLQ